MQKQSFIFNFLFSPRFRFLRHLLLILTFMVMSIGQALSDYREILSDLAGRIYPVIGIIFLNYVCVGYMAVYILGPRLLIRGKYIQFVICIVLAALAFVMVPNLASTKYVYSNGVFSSVAILDNVSNLFIYILGIFGVTVPVFLKNRMSEAQRISQLEKNRVSSEVEQLKEQINPASFFDILNQTGTLIKTDPDRASAMLMKLSRLLRYQLYDCNRSQVLLTAEIAFIRNFLEMEKLYNPQFNYSIETAGNLHIKFIPPCILLPYIQGTTKAFNNPTADKMLRIRINSDEKSTGIMLTMSGSYQTELPEDEIVRMKKRLQLLFKDNYELTVKAKDFLSETTEVCLLLYND